MSAGKKKKEKKGVLPDAEQVLDQLQEEIDKINAREDWSLPPPLPAVSEAAATPPEGEAVPATALPALPADPAPDRDEPQRGVGVEEKRLISRVWSEQLRRLGEE